MAALRTLETLLTASRRHDAGRSNGELPDTRAEAANGHCDVWRDLRHEIARARRFGRPFALVRIGRIAGQSLAKHLRTVDRPWVADGGTYVLLPEADREAAEGFVDRVRREAPDAVAGCAVSVAAFPDDGVTSGSLLKVLRTRTEPVHDVARQRPLQRIADSPPVHA